MLKTSNKIDYIQIKVKGNGIAMKIILYHENGQTYNIGNCKYKIEGNKLYISPFIRNELGYEYNLKGFKISHDMKTNETILIKMKK